MVDLDSDPTKLIEIVEIGKQLLITRGALTTFSIANDIAKYFAIIPAMFAARLPRPRHAQHHAAAQPDVGDPGRGHLQRADHRRADPAGAARRAVHARQRRRRCCAATCWSTASAASSPRSSASSSSTSHPAHPRDLLMRLPSWLAQHLAALRALLVLTVAARPRLPAGHNGGRRSCRPAEPRRRIAASRPDGSTGGQPADRPDLHRQRRQAARRSTSSPGPRRPVTATTRQRPPPPTSARRTSSTHCPTRTCPRATPASRACSARSAPAARLSAARGRRRAAALLHRRRGRRSARCLPPRRADRPGHPRRQRQPGLPRHAVHLDVGGRRASSAPARRGLLPRRGHPGPGDAPATPAVPADAVTASGSGLDPHISPAYAAAAGARVARGAGVDMAELERWWPQHTSGRALGFLGEPAVNVLAAQPGPRPPLPRSRRPAGQALRGRTMP